MRLANYRVKRDDPIYKMSEGTLSKSMLIGTNLDAATPYFDRNIYVEV